MSDRLDPHRIFQYLNSSNTIYLYIQKLMGNILYIIIFGMVSTQVTFFFISNKIVGQGGLYMAAVSKILEGSLIFPYHIQDLYIEDIIFPFPPGAFYLVATIHTITDIPILLIARVLPSILFIVSVVLFYRAVQKINDTQTAGLAAVLLFTFPAIYMRQVGVDGVTTTLSFVGIMAGLNMLEQTFIDIKSAILAGVCFAVALLAHPAGGLFFGLVFLSYWLGQDRSQNGLIRGATVALIGVVLASVWWFPVITQLHPEVLLNPLRTTTDPTLTPIIENFVNLQTLTLTIWSFPVIGGIYMLLTKRWWTVLLAIITIFSTGMIFLSIVICYIVALATVEWLIPSLLRVAEKDKKKWLPIIILSLIIFLLTFSGIGVGVLANSAGLSSDDIDSSNWIESNTEQSAVVAVQPHQTAEWFPYLTNRSAWAYHWGSEWSKRKVRERRTLRRERLEKCDEPECFEKLMENHTAPADFLVLHKSSVDIEDFNDSEKFTRVNTTNKTVIYDVRV